VHAVAEASTVSQIVGITSDGIDNTFVQFHRYYKPKYTELGYPMISGSTVWQRTLFNNNAGASSLAHLSRFTNLT